MRLDQMERQEQAGLLLEYKNDMPCIDMQ